MNLSCGVLLTICVIWMNLNSVYLDLYFEKDKSEVELEKQIGVEAAKDAFVKLIYGDKNKRAYKNKHIDTSKTLLEQLDASPDEITLDSLLRLLFQTEMTILVKGRLDLIADRKIRLGEVDKFSRQLETILDTLSEKGSNAITLGDMRNLIKTFSNDKLWITLARIRERIDHLEKNESENNHDDHDEEQESESDKNVEL